MALVALISTDGSGASPCDGSDDVIGCVVPHQSSCVQILPYNGSLLGNAVFEESSTQMKLRAIEVGSVPA